MQLHWLATVKVSLTIRAGTVLARERISDGCGRPLA